jgi:hypothetical protein
MKAKSELMEDNNKAKMDKDDENIIFVRSIFCVFSLACCLFLIIVYIILCLQRKFNICNKSINRNSNETIESDYSSIDHNKEKKNNRKGKIGLGSNFMFLLTISNFFGSLIEFLFYFYYKKMLLEEKESDRFSIKNYKDINNDKGCTFFGFSHNLWDLSSVCWTTMLTLLFYRSTNLSNEMLYKDKKYLIIGFIYCIVSCLIFCGLPLIRDNYGFARFYCSFRYLEFYENNEEIVIGEERISTIIYRWSFVIFIAINNLFNAYCLIKTFQFYSKKLALIKKQNKKEYNLMLIYVWVFRIFPIVLLVSRIFKGISRIIIEKLDGEGNVVKNAVEYINAFLFASNGIFDSIACIFFFKGIFSCCSSDSLSQSSSEEKGSNMNYLESEITD